MKRCIWCSRLDTIVTFKKKAHTIPKGLGGTDLSENVCDDCNAYFGKKSNAGPAIEEALKETFHISRLRFLHAMGEIGRNKTITRPDSLYFKFDLKKPSVTLKLAYQLRPHFQQKLCRLLKRGLYKMFLEESDRQFNNGHESKFDFIREFARYDLGDLPVFYFHRKHGIVLQDVDYPKSPKLWLKPGYQAKYLLTNLSFQEFEFMAHVFGVVAAKSWKVGYENYVKETDKLKKDLFRGFTIIKNLNEIDLSLQILNS